MNLLPRLPGVIDWRNKQKPTKRSKEHKRDFKSRNFSNALVIHNISKTYKIDFQHSNIIAFIHDKNNHTIFLYFTL